MMHPQTDQTQNIHLTKLYLNTLWTIQLDRGLRYSNLGGWNAATSISRLECVCLIPIFGLDLFELLALTENKR